MKNKPSDYGEYIDGIDPEEAKKIEAVSGKAVVRTYRSQDEWTVSEALWTSSFWFIVIAYSLCSMIIHLTTAHGVLHLTDLGYTKMQAAYALSLVLIGSLLRLPLAWLADYVEPRWVMSFVFLVTVVSVLLFWQAPSLTLVIAAAIGLGLTYGTGFVLMPTLVANYFHNKSFAKLNGVIMPINICAAAIVPVGMGYVYQYYKSYDLAFVIITALAMLSFILTLANKPPIKKT